MQKQQGRNFEFGILTSLVSCFGCFDRHRLMYSFHKSCPYDLFSPVKSATNHTWSGGFLTHNILLLSLYAKKYGRLQKKERFMVRQIKHFFQSSGLISSLIFTIVCWTLMVLFDAFPTKSLYLCLPVSLRLINLVLRNREDSAKKKFYRLTL